MPDVDPYVEAPQERPPRSRLDALRVWLALAVGVLLLAAYLTTGLVQSRQDPSLEIPAGADGMLPQLPSARPIPQPIPAPS